MSELVSYSSFKTGMVFEQKQNYIPRTDRIELYRSVERFWRTNRFNNSPEFVVSCNKGRLAVFNNIIGSDLGEFTEYPTGQIGFDTSKFICFSDSFRPADRFQHVDDWIPNDIPAIKLQTITIIHYETRWYPKDRAEEVGNQFIDFLMKNNLFGVYRHELFQMASEEKVDEFLAKKKQKVSV